jgi:hypothetical protein
MGGVVGVGFCKKSGWCSLLGGSTFDPGVEIMAFDADAGPRTRAAGLNSAGFEQSVGNRRADSWRCETGVPCGLRNRKPLKWNVIDACCHWLMTFWFAF